MCWFKTHPREGSDCNRSWIAVSKWVISVECAMTGSDAQVTKSPVHMHSMNIVSVCVIVIKVETCLSTTYVNHEDGILIIAYYVCMQKPCTVDAIYNIWNSDFSFYVSSKFDSASSSNLQRQEKRNIPLASPQNVRDRYKPPHIFRKQYILHLHLSVAFIQIYVSEVARLWCN